MALYLEKDCIVLNAAGGLARLGDYLGGEANQCPFALAADGIGIFRPPVITGRGSQKKLTWVDENHTLEIISKLVWDSETHILSRRDTLYNLGTKPLILRRYLARFAFNRGEYELYSQPSRWRRESLGAWSKLLGGKVDLTSRAGRWSEGFSPYALIRDAYSRHALAFTVCPEGDWLIRFCMATEAGKLCDLGVEAGLADDRLELELAPGEAWDAPEVMVQILPERNPASGIAAMNRYWNRRYPARPGHYPVIYNSWFDQTLHLDVARLEEELAAAKECGCEVFVIDYGWYEDFQTFTRVDNWEECRDRAFFGKMREFSDKVRAAGLGFGFWVEFEFFAVRSRVVKAHPDWFLPSAHENIVYPKTWLPEVEDYLVESIAEVIRRYDAVYFKNDMNHSQGFCAEHLSRYQKGMFRVMARVREMFPDVTLENCSSGGLRSGAGELLGAFDSHMLSDNCNQLDCLRLTQEMMLHFPPGRIMHWLVANELHPESGHQASFWSASFAPELTGEGLMVETQAATWDKFETVDLNTALVANLLGVPGYSCDFAGFSPRNRAKVKAANRFYQTYRESLTRAEGHWLTPPEALEKRTGWIGLQLSDPVLDWHFLYLFHDPTNGDDRRIFRPEALEPKRFYQVIQEFPRHEVTAQSIRGEVLLRRGLEVNLGYDQQGRTKAQLLLIAPCAK